MTNVYKMYEDNNVRLRKESNMYNIEKKPKKAHPKPINNSQPSPSMWDYLVSWFY